MTTTKDDVVRQLLDDICYCLHRHEVQTWKDCPGTLEDRANIALRHARDGLALLSGRIRPQDVGSNLAQTIASRDLVAAGGIADAP